MKYTVDMNDRPVYLQIYRLLRADIVGGAFAYGSRLPSKRLLAEELGVSTVTTEHAYDLLCEEGYAQARERSGYFVIFKRSDGFAASGGNFSEPAQEKHLGHSKPVFPLSLLSRTMRKVIADRADEILERSPHKGLMELRDALRQYLARNRGINVDAEQIVVGSGAEYLCGLKSGKFIKAHGLSGASSAKAALKVLEEKELVYRKPEGYVVYDLFMNLWLRRSY